MKFVDVYSKKTGRKQRIPEHWLGIPSLMKPFRKTPKQRNTDGETSGSTPSTADEPNQTPGTPDSVPAETTKTPHAGDNDKE